MANFTDVLGLFTDAKEAFEDFGNTGFLSKAQGVLNFTTSVMSAFELAFKDAPIGLDIVAFKANILKTSLAITGLATAIHANEDGKGSAAEIAVQLVNLVGGVAGVVGSIPGEEFNPEVKIAANIVSLEASAVSNYLDTPSGAENFNSFWHGLKNLVFTSSSNVITAYTIPVDFGIAGATWDDAPLSNIFAGENETSTNNQVENFTQTISGNVTTDTGNLGDQTVITKNGSATTLVMNDGYSEMDVYSATTNALLSDTWTNSAGTGANGTDTYNPDGSSSGKITYANGSYAMYTDDGQGNISTDYYTAAGVETRATWVHADGTSGEVSLYGDGLTLIPGGGPYPAYLSQYMVMQNPDGSYVTHVWDAQDSYTDTGYSGTGAVTSTSTGTGTGVNDLAVASSQDQFVEQSSYSDNAGSVDSHDGKRPAVNRPEWALAA